MKYALAVIENELHNLKVNEPIHRAEGNIEQADSDAAAISELGRAKRLIIDNEDADVYWVRDALEFAAMGLSVVYDENMHSNDLAIQILSAGKIDLLPLCYTDRMKIELEDLSVKIEKLKDFTEGNIFPQLEDNQKNGMRNQLVKMREYSEILADRIHYEESRVSKGA